MNSNLLQQRLDQVHSPSDSKAAMRSPQKVVQRHSPSVGYGTQQFKEYDGALAQLEA